VTAEVVHDDEVAGVQRGHKNLFNIDSEALAIDWAIQQPRCFNPVMPECRDERHGVPMPIRNFTEQPGAARRPAAQWRHVGLGPGLVDEGQPVRLNPRLIAAPLQAPARDVGTILFAGVNRFF